MTNNEAIIVFPEKLNNRSTFQFVNGLWTHGLVERFVVDFSSTVRAFPFSILFVQSALRQFMSSMRSKAAVQGFCPEFAFEGIDIKRNAAHGYLAHIGFFKSLGIDAGKEPGEALGGDTYVPITAVEKRVLFEHAEDQGIHYGTMIIRQAERLAHIFFRAMDSAGHTKALASVNKVTTYCIREMLRNAIEHSGSDRAWFCGQYYPSLSLVEIGIVDEGMGVDRSMSRIHSIPSIRVALDLATRPGYSGNADKYKEDDDWVNTGFGLYTTSRLCARYAKGQFCLASNGSALTVERDRSYYIDVPFQGTAVMLKLFVGNGAAYANALEEIVSQGEAIAGTEVVASASKMSKVL